MKFFACFVSFVALCETTQAQRQDILLNTNWQTIANDTNQHAYEGFEAASYKTKNWQTVNVPHNWDAYEGYRRLLHGNRHGYAWYKKTITVTKQTGKRYFLFFEGVGSYATVYVNGKQVGYHAGGRTSFTIDITDHLLPNKTNLLAVRADHPANIKDLPWVCGGCSDERGFSEGSQPMGIFRPVHLIVTNETRIEPFGVHIWNDTTVSEKSATLYLETTFKNYASQPKTVTITNQLLDARGTVVAKQSLVRNIQPGELAGVPQSFNAIKNIHLWSLENPYLYKIKTSIVENGKVVDETVIPYGIRWISWPVGKPASANQFYLNGKPVFINGIAEYEHLLGQSHAFSAEQIKARVKWIQAAGFNAFRDGHQPHNLRYQNYWDSLGILWWTQLSAHVWYDTKEFRDNFKALLKEWVIERRNSPSVVLWGLQNESKIPADFAKECTELIRSLDPTSSSQRLVTTCNGGSGTDWDVPQNWTGTYGGNPLTYSDDVKRQVLIGEYGAWRTLDLHTEGGFKQNGALSEDRMTQLMETKIRLAEAAKDSTSGHFFWLLTSHDNPGRMQGGEGLRELDRIGPVNYKGILTPWEEPTDAFYMFRSNYASKYKEPIVYIASHTWPGRWTTTGKKDSIIVYSNCDEVELFNDVEMLSLGKRNRNGIGTHFQWDGVNINYNVLYAIGYVNGKAVTKDYIVLNHLPKAPHFEGFYKDAKNITQPQPNYNYIYRVNCGGPDYKDANGNTWQADKAVPSTINGQPSTADAQRSTVDGKRSSFFYGSSSWTNDFPGMPSFFASQRRTNAPIAGTKDWPLFQTFRYGRDKLSYQFPVPDGEYMVELYFTEPWLGIGSNMNCKGMRLFDITINDKVVIKDLDIWNEAGANHALKKTVKVNISGGKLVLSFPNTTVGQAVIAAVAIASVNKNMLPAKAVPALMQQVKTGGKYQLNTWLDNGDKQFIDDKISFSSLPSNLFGAEYLQLQKHGNGPVSFTLSEAADVFVTLSSAMQKPAWLTGFDDTKTTVENDNGSTFNVYRKRFVKDAIVSLATVSNESVPFTVFALPVNNMQPAYDLKAVTSYKPLQAKVSDGAERTTINTRDAVTFKTNSASMEWNISTGVADVYSITIRYSNETGKDLGIVLELFAADGTLMKTEPIILTQSIKGKWSYAVTNTGSMINAGNYIIKIKAANAVGAGISALDIQ